MAYNPKTGLVYIPAQEIGQDFAPVKDFKPSPLGWNIAVAATPTPDVKGRLLAWDPVQQKEAWRVEYLGPWNGGVLTTAGNLVAQGDAAGNFNVYRADSGEKLWSISAQTAVMAGPWLTRSTASSTSRSWPAGAEATRSCRASNPPSPGTCTT
jgi:hypothetical protein